MTIKNCQHGTQITESATSVRVVSRWSLHGLEFRLSSSAATTMGRSQRREIVYTGCNQGRTGDQLPWFWAVYEKVKLGFQRQDAHKVLNSAGVVMLLIARLVGLNLSPSISSIVHGCYCQQAHAVGIVLGA
ncbi:hypothetical protein C5167_004252 [Papaver somniferum]|nr:hypothetical protein C5167_004252 [Papaver somniferum]